MAVTGVREVGFLQGNSTPETKDIPLILDVEVFDWTIYPTSTFDPIKVYEKVEKALEPFLYKGPLCAVEIYFDKGTEEGVLSKVEPILRADHVYALAVHWFKENYNMDVNLVVPTSNWNLAVAKETEFGVTTSMSVEEKEQMVSAWELYLDDYLAVRNSP